MLARKASTRSLVRRLNLACNRGAPRNLDRRHSQAIARLQPMLRSDAPAVDPHFSAAQDAVDVAFGHPFQESREVIVDPLALALLSHFVPGCGFFT